jgi:asparagine synthetase B (glutamine-hydrolysing)
MCGIFGSCGFDNGKCSEVGSLLFHRGPDAFGEYEDKENRIYLSHNRLAIIDLSVQKLLFMLMKNGEKSV